MSCEFVNNKTKKQCVNDAINGNRYCTKHKRYNFPASSRNKNKSEQNTIQIKKNTSEDIVQHESQQDIINPKIEEQINGIDMSNIMNDNDANIIINQNKRFNDDLETKSYKSNDQDNEDFETNNPEEYEDLDMMHDPDTVSEMIFPFIITASQLVEKSSEMISDKTGVVIKGMTDDTIKKEKEYKQLIKAAYEEDPTVIDDYVTPGYALVMHFVASGIKSVEKKKD